MKKYKVRRGYVFHIARDKYASEGEVITVTDEAMLPQKWKLEPIEVKAQKASPSEKNKSKDLAKGKVTPKAVTDILNKALTSSKVLNK